MAKYWAMFRRWLYLLFIGMYCGESAIDLYDHGRLVSMRSGHPLSKDRIIWWELKVEEGGKGRNG